MTRNPHSHATHRALVYRDSDGSTREVAAFVRDGLEHGERVLAALTPEKLDWLQGA